MQRDFINIDYHITFETPFHFGTGLRRNLLDRSVSRDANGYLYIPGSTLKGVLRERCEQIARLAGLRAVSPHDGQKAIASFRNNIDIVDRIFGSRYKPSELYFDNATMIKGHQDFFDSVQISQKYLHLQTEERTQTSISRVLGTVREQALFQSEFGIKTLCFEGQIYGYLEGFHLDGNAGTYSLLLLVAGFCANNRIGANKSTGMGKYDCDIREFKVNDETMEVSDLLASLVEDELILHQLILYQDVQDEYYKQEEAE